MVKIYTCEKCGKTFKQKGHYTKHLQRKTPCDNVVDSKIEKLVEEKVNKVVDEKIQELLENKNLINDIDDNSSKEMDNLNCKTSLLDDIIYLIEKKGKKYIINELNIVNGTLQRWLDNKNVPKSYQIDIKKMRYTKIDYSKFTYKEKDQFFTRNNVCEYSYNKFIDIMKKYGVNLDNYIYIEPSAGDGAFLKVLPKNTISFDIEPRNNSIIKQDYLKWEPKKDMQKYITFGNPPFGLRGNLALKFINHSSKFSEHLCFILPPLFESDGRGSPMKRVIGYNLIHSEKIETDFYDPSGKNIKVNVILQIWSKSLINNKYKQINSNNKLFKIYSLSDGKTPGTTRNKIMLNNCDIYIPSTCFGIENMKIYNSFEELPKRRGYGIKFNDKKDENILKSKDIDWGKISFLSTNSAYNLRMSKISNALMDIM